MVPRASFGRLTSLVAVAILLPVIVIAQKTNRPGETFRDCGDCPEMIVVPAGSFEMGAPESDPAGTERERPVRRVTVSAFGLGKFPVTRGQWAAFASAANRPTVNGCAWTARSRSKPDPAGSWRDLGFPQDDAHPVVCVTWHDAVDYINWLSERTKQRYRLPTEAEYEYAARAGTTTPYPWGTTVTHDNANYGADTCCNGLAAGRDKWEQTSPVGAFAANAFGLHDMHGNVMQWMQDCFQPSYVGLPTDGSANQNAAPLQLTGPMSRLNGQSACDFRMLRGGDWGNPPAMIRSTSRNFGPGPGGTLKDYRSGGLGFRVARSLQ
jgi:formylglycine-generating enzyme required for sulfatase activity